VFRSLGIEHNISRLEFYWYDNICYINFFIKSMYVIVSRYTTIYLQLLFYHVFTRIYLNLKMNSVWVKGKKLILGFFRLFIVEYVLNW